MEHDTHTSLDPLKYIADLSTEVYEVIYRLHVKKNRNLEMLKEWNEYAQVLHDIEAFVQDLHTQNINMIDDYALLPKVVKLLCYEITEYVAYIKEIFTMFREGTLSEGYPEDIIDGIISIMYQNLKNDSTWVTVDDMLQAKYDQHEHDVPIEFDSKLN